MTGETMTGETNKYEVDWSSGHQCKQILDLVCEKSGCVKWVEVKTQSKYS